MIRSHVDVFEARHASLTTVRRRSTSSGARLPSARRDRQRRLRRFRDRLAFGAARARPAVAIEHVVAGDFVFAGAHQREFDLVLNVFDVQRAARRKAPLERRAHLVDELRTCSRMRDDAAAVPPSTARKALVIATAILLSSYETTRAVALDHPQLAGRGGRDRRGWGPRRAENLCDAGARNVSVCMAGVTPRCTVRNRSVSWFFPARLPHI